MTTYIEVAQALVSAGYLSDADVEAASDVLEDALIIADAEDAQDAAADDYSEQEDLIAKAEVWANEDEAMGDIDTMEVDEDIIADAAEQEMEDQAVMAAAEDEIDAAYLDAASALLAAELIDEADLQPVAVVIANVWAVDD